MHVLYTINLLRRKKTDTVTSDTEIWWNHLYENYIRALFPIRINTNFIFILLEVFMANTLGFYPIRNLYRPYL